MSLIVWHRTRRRGCPGVPRQITRRRCQGVNLVLIGPKLDVELIWTATDNNLPIGRIIAGPGDME